MVVVADPRQVSMLWLMGPLSTPYGGVGVVAGGRLAGWLAVPSSPPFTGGGVGEGVVAGVQLGNTARPRGATLY